MPRPRISLLKRQREQAKRERQQRKAARREDRKREEAETPGSPADENSGKTE